MKKCILLFSLIFFITGCTARYDLVINENTIEEKTSIVIPQSDVDYSVLKNQLTHERNVYATGESTYESDFAEVGNDYRVSYNYTHDFNRYYKSSFINLCYGKNQIENTAFEIKIATDKYFNCIYMDDGINVDAVDINIKTKLKVKQSNADEVHNNVYTWHITKENYKNKPINMTIKKSKNMIIGSDLLMHHGIILFSVVFVILVIIGCFVIKKVKIQDQL